MHNNSSIEIRLSCFGFAECSYCIIITNNRIIMTPHFNNSIGEVAFTVGVQSIISHLFKVVVFFSKAALKINYILILNVG